MSCQSAMAHIALAHDASFGGILRHIVRAFQDAILATDALVIEMANDPCVRILLVSEHGTTIEAGGVEAMMARGGYGLLIRLDRRASLQQPHGAPGFIIIESVEGMARTNTRFASGAQVQINGKGVLFARAWLSEWYQAMIIASLSGKLGFIVLSSETFNGGELLLLGEQISAEEAERIGIVNKVVPADEFDDAVGDWARKLASKSPVMMRLGKDAMFRQLDMPFEEALDFLRSQLTIAFSTEDIQEGVKAFFEKREPVWTGR